MMLVHLALLAVCLAAVSGGTPECYDTYTLAVEEHDHTPRQYWDCKGYGEKSTLETCDDAKIYDRKTGQCVVARKLRDGRLVKRKGSSDSGKNIVVIEREALGETLSLGTLYDARKSLVANGLSFWKKATLDAKSAEVDTTYSNMEVYMEKSIEERAYRMGIDASIKLEFLGGLISVGGSAHYLRDEKSSTDVARVTMNYYATTKTHILPIYTPKDHNDLCTTIDGKTGPTHVVSSVTYGIRSFMLFEREVSKKEYTEEIGGSLSIAVKSIPSLQVEASALVDVDGKEVNNKDTMRIKFYGDVVLGTLPSTYNQTVAAFQEVNEAAKESKTPIKYQLTPIEMYCTETEARINAINEGQTQKVTSVLTELGDVKRRLTTLLGKDPAIRFSSIRKQLLTFQNGLNSYTTTITAQIATAIPAVKAGDMTDQQFMEIYGDYLNSKWNKARANIFLDHRAREIRTLELGTEGTKAYPEVALSAIGEATDNKCLFNYKYSTIFQLYVLPAENVAEMYIKDEYTDETESNQWYNDLFRVGQAGKKVQMFLKHAQLNAHPDDHCFLIRLDTMTSNQNEGGNDALIRLYKNGKIIDIDFKPPMPPAAPTCTKNLYNAFRLSGVENTDAASHVTAVRVTASWKKEKEKKEDDKSDIIEYDYFPTVFTVLNKDVNSFTINKLLPDKEYEITMAYRVGQDLGFSGESEIAHCTTGATSAPVLPQVTGHTPKSVSLKWSAPQQIVDSVGLDEISYIVTAAYAPSYLRVTCDNKITGAWVDGESLGLANVDNVWTKVSTKDLPVIAEKFTRVAIKCKDNGGQHGIIASLHDKEGTVFGTTDTSWYCKDLTESEEPNWWAPGTELGWSKAASFGKNGVSPWGDKASDVNSQAEWIWTSQDPDQSGRTVGCYKDLNVNTDQVKRKLETSELELTVDELEQGNYYDFTIQPVYQGVRSPAARLNWATVPYAPDVPLLTSVTTGTMQLAVHIERINLPTKIRKDAVVVRFYKMDSAGSEALYGTDKFITVAVSNPDGVQAITINGLAAGIKYGVRARLRMEVNGRLFETAESEGLIVTTLLPKGPEEQFARIEDNLNTYKTETETAISALESKATNVGADSDAITRKTDTEFGKIETKIQEIENTANVKLGAYDLFAAGLTKDSCIMRGIQGDSSTRKLGTYNNINNEFVCLQRCSNAFSNTRSVTLVKKVCHCFNKPITSLAFDLKRDSTSIDVKCFDVAGAPAAKWKSCVNVNKDFLGGDIFLVDGVTSIRDCAIICSQTANCRSGTYSRREGRCFLKHKDTGDRIRTYHGLDSFTISCLV